MTNRETGEKYYRPYPDRIDAVSTPAAIDKALREKVIEIHTSPFLRVDMLWYDEALDMLFFELIRRMDEHGHPTTSERTAVRERSNSA